MTFKPAQRGLTRRYDPATYKPQPWWRRLFARIAFWVRVLRGQA